MTAHEHRTVVDGCYRCELGQVESAWITEAIAKAFHAAYERLAPSFHYSTREATSVPWVYLPGDNRRLMLATVDHLLDTGVIEAGDNIYDQE